MYCYLEGKMPGGLHKELCNTNLEVEMMSLFKTWIPKLGNKPFKIDSV